MFSKENNFFFLPIFVPFFPSFFFDSAFGLTYPTHYCLQKTKLSVSPGMEVIASSYYISIAMCYSIMTEGFIYNCLLYGCFFGKEHKLIATLGCNGHISWLGLAECAQWLTKN